jgi:uncharacterized phiE125 gp8 family phage protein
MSQFRYKNGTPPTEEPVTLAELKTYLKISNSVEDALITEMGKAARVFIEEMTDKRLITQTKEWYLDGFPTMGRNILISTTPLTGVVVEYIDVNTTDRTYTTWDAANYILDDSGIYPRISLKNNVSFPSTVNEINSVKITLSLGYGLAADVPENFKIAIKLLVAEMYENRENRTYSFGTSGYNVPTYVNFILNNKRDFGFFTA